RTLYCVSPNFAGVKMPMNPLPSPFHPSLCRSSLTSDTTAFLYGFAQVSAGAGSPPADTQTIARMKTHNNSHGGAENIERPLGM
ncbi:hypothetical protein PFISCL1PPCAC_4851, partial [Pristionchus fissidentatus]